MDVSMKVKTKMGKISPLGVSALGKEVQFACVTPSDNCGVVLYDVKDGAEMMRIPFPEKYRVGNVHTMCVSGLNLTEFLYDFYEGDRLLCDLYARKFKGNEVYGDIDGIAAKKAVFAPYSYDWEGDVCPRIPYEQSFVYCMHVRGFTKHGSSKVKHKGTFRGVEEKIPYLQELGITTLEFQPVYEFDEVRKRQDGAENEPANYWGYTRGHYYAPKSSYAALEDSVRELKDLIKALHKKGMEAVLQFYFPWEVKPWEILDILRFWVLEYHVDGFHIKSPCKLMDLICGDPVLQKTKLWHEDFGAEYENTQENSSRTLGIYRDDYLYDLRRFVKGDEGMLEAVLRHMRQNPANAGIINYVTNYSGFTLKDLVSYDRKHNEENGENNRDGSDYNFSWNCGEEGSSKKRSVNSLRRKQIKNFLTLLFFSQGTPLVFMGDEFCNSQGGNNNPYGQDNETTWLNWKDLEKNEEIFAFVKNLAALRKAHPILRMEKQFQMRDYISCGCPDLSYHGMEPWKPDMGADSRHIGVMLCGTYGKTEQKREGDSFYLCINMHWEVRDFILPDLPKGEQWNLCICTEDTKKNEGITVGMSKVSASPRSIYVFQSSKKDGKKA